MGAYIVFAVCAFIAGTGMAMNSDLGEGLAVMFGLAAVVVPFLMTFGKGCRK